MHMKSSTSKADEPPSLGAAYGPVYSIYSSFTLQRDWKECSAATPGLGHLNKKCFRY